MEWAEISQGECELWKSRRGSKEEDSNRRHTGNRRPERAERDQIVSIDGPHRVLLSVPPAHLLGKRIQ